MCAACDDLREDIQDRKFWRNTRWLILVYVLAFGYGAYVLV